VATERFLKGSRFDLRAGSVVAIPRGMRCVFRFDADSNREEAADLD
jgi:hypothetical protein